VPRARRSAVLAATYGATLAVFPAITAATCSASAAAPRPPCDAHPPAGRLFGAPAHPDARKPLATPRPAASARRGNARAGDLWVPMLFLVYNGGDLLGRMAAGCGRWAAQAPRLRVLGAYCAARVAVAAALLFCRVVTPRPWRLPAVFGCAARPAPPLLPAERPPDRTVPRAPPRPGRA